MNPFDRFLKPEDIVHIQVCNYVAAKYPAAVVYHSPNEGKRSPFERYLIKKLRVLSGFPDLVIFSKSAILFIELKTPKGTVSPAQKWWIQTLNQFGFSAFVCFGYEQAQRIIDEHFISLTKQVQPLNNQNNVSAF